MITLLISLIILYVTIVFAHYNEDLAQYMWDSTILSIKELTAAILDRCKEILRGDF